ncbi:B-cell scaffold protein with ankyrin repeats-like [Pseudochaenichthys georgianus]|uniref:B-cell scaffold protein with ankyrin repeats-like n=1 Tax=Pseudochaenichthys georgianus TaxID=52239 RepID=UPI00146BFEA8|nr:B-cell scaffold protein with ankyrin repeats-like [Pseudochaenichthys georgianus]
MSVRAQQWATYLRSVFTGSLSEASICSYDIATVSSRQDDFLRLSQYSCKGMLEGLCPKRRFFLARVLCPATAVVVLLCGVESLAPLLEQVPLNGDDCLQVSSEQHAHGYLSAVTDIVKKGALASAANVKPLIRGLSERKAAARSVRSMAVVPSRVPCGSSTEVFILLKNESAGSDAEVEFTADDQRLRVKPVCWNERILCVNAPDFPAGHVRVTVYSNGVPLSKAQLQYYSNMEEITCLLARAADPVHFMCQYGFRSVCSVLLQCPGAGRALHTANRHGHTPTEIAKTQGHTQLHVLLKERLNMFSSDEDNGDASVYEMMCAAGTTSSKHAEPPAEEGEEEDIYLPLEDGYDSILNSTKAVVIANRPPAPTPRPEGTQVKEDGTPYITKARGREDSISATYDTFVPKQMSGLQTLIELQQSVKGGALTVDAALERLSDFQRVQKGGEEVQQEKLNQPRASIVSSREADDSVYDKINIVHHTPSVTESEVEEEAKK